MKWSGPLAAALLLAWTAAPGHAADLLAQPQWSADQVRAARPITAEDALVFDLKSESRGGAVPARTTVQTVTLAPSFVAIEGNGDHVLDDYALCRTFAWSDDKPGFDSKSCYASVAFRAAEIYNRRGIAKLMAAAGAKGDDDDPYWSEAELAFQDEAVERLAKHGAPDALDYRLGQKSVVRTNGRAADLTPTEAASFARFLARHAMVHPQVRRDLKAGGVLPAQMQLTLSLFGARRDVTLNITNVRRTKVPFPLPAGAQSSLRLGMDEGDTAKARALHQILVALDGHSTIAKPTADMIVASMQDASDHGHETDVVLLFLQLTQQYAPLLTGPDKDKYVAALGPVLRKAAQDPEAGRFLAINAMAGDRKAQGDRQAAARWLANATALDKSPFGTFRYLTFINLVANSPDADKWDPAIVKSMPTGADGDWIHIAAYPWASNAYKDAGDTYYEAFDTVQAWLAFDLGRAIDKDWRSGTMKSVSDSQDKMRAGERDFF
ncbi:MAG TPA: hypothetical protein VG407_04035 [Caulobacteraceae bacterium]|jgi:hypothetical protein|nr:hypothetical protein [Caulobacteraceae bacterium]